MTTTADRQGPAASAPAAPHVVESQGLGFAVGGATIVDDVTLGVRAGEFLAVIGPNGAGKTTLFNLLTGILRPTAGRIFLGGHEITTASTVQRARLGLSRSFQVTSLFSQLSVLENVRLAARAHLGGSGKLWTRIRRDDPAVVSARAALETVGLAERADDLAASLSHGNKRKLDL
ncbi:MAG TPA: ATP-binding cassette domain-containing protein, partial [Jiangellaceae bacterium]|nr:ATP-binding cassette domain-containing protein [Jiangellaceae bacterium]